MARLVHPAEPHQVDAERMVGAGEVRIDLGRRARSGEAALELGAGGFIAVE